MDLLINGRDGRRSVMLDDEILRMARALAAFPKIPIWLGLHRRWNGWHLLIYDIPNIGIWLHDICL